jgi:hypothetical protein
LSPELQQIVAQGLEVLSKGNKTTVLCQYRIGSLLLQVEKHAAANDVDAVISTIAAEWGVDPKRLSRLYAARNVAAAFSLSFVREQLEQPLKCGNYLTWAHFLNLQKVQDEAKVQLLLQEVRENSLTAKELALQLAGEAAVKRAGGRRPAVPASPRAMLRKVTLSTQHTTNYLSSVITPLDELIAAGVDYDDKLSDELASAVSQLSVMSAQASEALRRVKQLQSKMGKKPKEGKPARSKKSAKSGEDAAPAVASPAVVPTPGGVRRKVKVARSK